MDCLFCKIINGEIPSYKVYEDDLVYAFLDINPAKNGHTLIVPKKHYTDYLELDMEIIDHILEVTKKISKEICEKLDAKGVTFAWNYGDKQVIKHFHLHIMPNDEGKEKLPVEEVYDKIK